MGMAAEPRPASLPLPGGRADSTVRLHPLLVARMHMPPALLHSEQGRLAGARALGIGVPRDRFEEVPVVAFCVEHPSAGRLLIDTGFHASVAIDPKPAMGRAGGRVFKDVRMDSSDAVPAQLRAREISPDSVRTVVMTHLHSDHAGGIAQFPDATFVVAEAEWRAAVDGGELDGYVKRQFDHGFLYRLLDFEGPDAASFASFGRAADLFGDGSVVCVSTPGHSEGHMSVVLRLARGEALICGDAAVSTRALRDSHLPGRMVDEHRFRRSLREIQRYAQQTPGALLIPGHDMAAWRRLDAVYA